MHDDGDNGEKYTELLLVLNEVLAMLQAAETKRKKYNSYGNIRGDVDSGNS